jgi:phosphoglycolate phosphatase
MSILFFAIRLARMYQLNFLIITNQKMNKFPKAVIFDWDNTLVNSWSVIHFALNKTMEKMGKDLWSEEEVRDGIHKSARDLFPELFGNRWEEAAEIFKENYRAQHLQKVKFIPRTVDLIDFLNKKNIPLFVISNKTGEALRLETSHLGVANKFLSIVGAGDADFDKPHKAPVDLVLKGSDLDPTKDLIWFVGDTMTDIQCAINSGCQPILYGDNFDLSKDLSPRKIIHFQNHQEILKYLS